jgi:hypothetical protein
MKFVRKTAKCTWQDYKRNEDILSEIKIKPVVKEIQNYRKKMDTTFLVNGQRQTDRQAHLIMKWTETDRRTATLNYEMSSM